MIKQLKLGIFIFLIMLINTLSLSMVCAQEGNVADAVYTDKYITGGTSSKYLYLDEDIECKDLYLNKYVDLNGHTVTVHGSLYQQDGYLVIGEGCLSIENDYIIANYNEGAYNTTTGCIKMENTSDTVIIGGDFIVNCTTALSGGYYTFNFFEKGEIYIGGNYIVSPDSLSSFKGGTGQEHIVHFTGENVQHKVSMGKSNSYWEKLLVEDNGTILIDNGYFGANILLSDVNIQVKEKAYITKLNQNTYNVTFESDNESKEEIEVISLGNWNIGSGILSVEGDVITTNGGTFDCNAGLVEVKGSFIKTNTDMDIESGELYIDKDFIMADYDEEHDKYNLTKGSFVMSKSEGYVKVKGDVIINNSLSVSGGYPTYLYYQKGTMEIGGSYIVLADSYRNFRSSSSYEHHIVFSGENVEHKIDLQKSDFGFGHISVEDGGSLFVENYFRAVELESDLNIRTNSSVKFTGFDQNTYNVNIYRNDAPVDEVNIIADDWRVNGGKLTIDGNLTMSSTGSLNCNDGIVSVTGNYAQTAGSLVVEDGEFNIDGDCIMASYNKNTNKYNAANVRFCMEDKVGIVRVKGSFYINSSNSYASELDNGKLYIAGNFHEYGTSNNEDFAATENHLTILNGTTHQTVIFEGEKSHFGTLMLLQDDSAYTFTPENCYLKLSEEKESSSSSSSKGSSSSSSKSSSSSSSKSSSSSSSKSSSSSSASNYDDNKFEIKYEVGDDVKMPTYRDDYYRSGSKKKITTVPQREGYKFAGWYFDSSLTRKAKITKNTTGDLILYPKWKGCSYTIEYMVTALDAYQKPIGKQKLTLGKTKYLKQPNDKKLSKAGLDSFVTGWTYAFNETVSGNEIGVVSWLNGKEAEGIKVEIVKTRYSSYSDETSIVYIMPDLLVNGNASQQDFEDKLNKYIKWSSKGKGYVGEIKIYPIYRK